MIVWFDRFGNRREQIYEDGTLTAGSYAFDKLYVYWDNEENFISKTPTQLQGTVVDFKLADGTEVEGVVTSIVAKEMPYIKDVDYRFFKAKKIYRFIECAIPSSVTAQNGLVTAQIKVMVNSSLVKTLVGVDFVVDGHKATNRDISDADYRNILANYMPYTGGTFTGPVVFTHGLSLDNLELQSLTIGELAPITEDAFGGEPCLSLGQGNNVKVDGRLLVENPAQFNGGITDGDVSVDIANIEDKRNKTSIISSASTNAQYPTAKALFDIKEELRERIENVESRGRFLSAWDAETGLPETFPIIPDGAPYPYEYEYRAGDYFIVSKIPESGTAYKPSGSSITKQDASSPWTVGKAVESDSVAVNSLYVYDGISWNLIASGGEVATWGSITGNINSQSDLKNALDTKADDNDVVHKTGDETISGKKTLTNPIYFTSAGTTYISGASGTLFLNSNNGLVETNAHFRPISSNSVSIGNDSYRWKDIYLSGALNFKSGASTSAWSFNDNGYNQININYGSTLYGYLTTDGLTLNGLFPLVSGTSNIGASDKRWNNIYMNGTLYLSTGNPNCWIAGADGDIYLRSHNGLVKTNSHFRPESDATLSLGYSNKRWADLYLSGKLKDGTNEVSIADIVTKSKTEDLSSTSITLTASPDTEYVYGALSSLSIALNNGTSNGQEISIMWESGSTATTLTLNGTNKAHGSIVPSANMYCELNCKWYRGKWVILYSEVSSL